MKLIVWQYARSLYVLTCRMSKGLPFELKKIASQQVASVDSIHRKIAEGYCRRTINECLQHLNVAMGSSGESVSSMHVHLSAGHISQTDFDTWDQLAFKLENGLKRLIESLQERKEQGDWKESYLIRESNAVHGEEEP